MKICVYTISKNEEKFVDRWVNSMNEADSIYVLDTGSTDNTVEKLKNKGVIVKTKEIKPWRFDIARNLSLEMVPEDCDICVCTDLDEVFLPGWRYELEKLWNSNIDRIQYNYNWSLDKDDNPLVNFYIEKIHTRKNYVWTHPVHEILTCTKEFENKITTDNITVNHYPDNTKSRSSYLPLLELSVKESPNDDRNMHYLGREYMYYKRYNEAIDTLIKHLRLPSAAWADERCASMRFIARSYLALERYDEAEMWLNKAIKEAPHLKDPLIEKAFLSYILENWDEVIKNCEKALKITFKYKNYINEPFSWDNTVYDLLSIAYFYKGNTDKAILNINKAIEMNPSDERLIQNKQIFEMKKKSEN